MTQAHLPRLCVLSSRQTNCLQHLLKTQDLSLAVENTLSSIIRVQRRGRRQEAGKDPCTELRCCGCTVSWSFALPEPLDDETCGSQPAPRWIDQRIPTSGAPSVGFTLPPLVLFPSYTVCVASVTYSADRAHVQSVVDRVRYILHASFARDQFTTTRIKCLLALRPGAALITSSVLHHQCT